MRRLSLSGPVSGARYMSKTWRPTGCALAALCVSICSISILLAGCAASGGLHRLTHSVEQDIRSLTPDESERAALRSFAADYPDMTSQGDLKAVLGGYRQGQLRRRALEVQFRHQYPKATREEVDMLVQGQMVREGPPRSSVNCTSMKLGFGMTDTSCY